MSFRGPAARGGGAPGSAGPTSSRLSTGPRSSNNHARSGNSTPNKGWASPAPSNNAKHDQQQHPASAAAAASAFPSLAASKTTTQHSGPAGKMRDRTLFVLISLIGNTVVATTKDARKFVGILHSTTPGDAELGIALTSAQEVLRNAGATEDSLGPPAKLLVLKASDLDTVDAHDVVLGEPVRPETPAANGFRTDVEISARDADDRLDQGRQLMAWSDDEPSATPGAIDGLGAPSSANSNNAGAWDQFAANEARFGVKSNYDEDMYTTKLDRSRKNFKEEEQKAEKLAAEIMGQTSTNAHLAEERGHADDSGQNEEDKYGAVVRGPGAYIPPAARRAAAATSNPANGSPRGADSTATGGAVASSNPLQVLQESAEKKAAAAAAAAAAASSPSASADVPGIAVKVPTPTKLADSSAAGPTAGVESTSPATANSIRDFHQFVASEKARVQNQRMAAREQQKRATVNKEQNEQNKQRTLNDLKAWSTNFKLKTPIPDDVASVMSKSPDSTTAVPNALQKSLSPATAHAERAGKGSAALGTSSTATSPSGGAGTASAVAKTPSSTGNSVANAKLAESKALLAKMQIPKIPPFKAKTPATQSQQQPQPTQQQAKASPSIPSSVSTTFKMSAKANAFKPFNPAAASFTPGGSTASAAQPATSTASIAASRSVNFPPVDASVPVNPFFGTRVLKMSTTPIHVREDFTPFKAGKVPDPASVPANWPYNGRSHRVVVSSGQTQAGVDQAQHQPDQSAAPSTTGSSSHQHTPAIGIPLTPASQHQSAHGTPLSQASGLSGSMPPQQQLPAQVGASPSPMHQHQHMAAGGPMPHMPGPGPHPGQQGQPPFGIVYQTHQPPGAGPYRFPPQQAMQGQYMVHGMPAMGMPVGPGGPPMAYGGPGPPQPGMPPQFMGNAHAPHAHVHLPQQHMHGVPPMNQQHQQPHHHPNAPHHAVAHHTPMTGHAVPPQAMPVGMGVSPHQMQFGSPQIPGQQHINVNLGGGGNGAAGISQSQQGPQGQFHASPQIGSRTVSTQAPQQHGTPMNTAGGNKPNQQPRGSLSGQGSNQKGGGGSSAGGKQPQFGGINSAGGNGGGKGRGGSSGQAKD